MTGQSKIAHINGAALQLHALGRAFRLCAFAGLFAVFMLAVTLALLISGMGVPAALAVLAGQTLAAGTVGFAFFLVAQASSPLNDAPSRSLLGPVIFGVVAGLITLIPLLGLLPAADMCRRAHRIFLACGISFGVIGPTPAQLRSLCMGRCHNCGYSVDQHGSDLCPECGNDVTACRTTTSILKPVRRVDPAQAEALRALCVRWTFIGVVVGFGQLILLVTITGRITPWLLPLVYLPGPLYSGVALHLGLRARRILGGTSMRIHLAAVIASLVSPMFGGFILDSIGSRLGTAARDGVVV